MKDTTANYFLTMNDDEAEALSNVLIMQHYHLKAIAEGGFINPNVSHTLRALEISERAAQRIREQRTIFEQVRKERKANCQPGK